MHFALGRMLGVVGTGVLLAVSFPPFELDGAAWLALVPLLLVVDSAGGVGHAFLLGVAGTLPFFVGVAYGLWPFDARLALLFPSLLGLSVGVVFAAHRALAVRTPSPWLRALLLPSLWILAEYATTALGIPWSLAISQTKRLLLVQSAALLGMSWIAFTIVLVNVALYEATLAMRGRRAPHPAAAALAVAALAANLAYGTWCFTSRAEPATALRVATIQPMLSSELYTYQWLNPEYRRTVLEVVDGLSATAASTRPDLLVWPENGNGQVNFRVPSRRAAVAELARRSGATLLLSSYDADESGRMYNAVFSVGPDGALLGRYAKVHLAPGGEPGFSAGAVVAPLSTPHGPVGALVCLESCLPWVARSLTAQGARLLVVTTSDVAMRASAPPLNHARFAVYRAIENRRAVVQASNGGPSSLISPFGEVTDETGFLTRATLAGRVALTSDATPYTRLGDWPLLGAALGLLVWTTLRRRRVDATETTVGWLPFASVPAALAAGLGIAVASLGTIGAAHGESLARALASFVETPPIAWPRDGAAAYRNDSDPAGGTAALAYALQVFGLTTCSTDLLPRLPRDPDLATLAGIVHAAGLRAWSEEADLGALRALPMPVMARANGRWVVVLAVRDDHVELFDPAAGFVRAATREFQAGWPGTLLIIRYAALGDGAERTEQQSERGGGHAASAVL